MSSLRIVLPQDVTSPAEARRRVSRFAAENRLEQADIVLLVTSELVTNAVAHGAEPISISVTCESEVVRVEVSDSDPDAARVNRRPPTTEYRPGGRGLHIVESVTQRWGTVQHHDGKTVWAEIRRSERRTSAPTSATG